jgi:ankyrin repeat protein
MHQVRSLLIALLWPAISLAGELDEQFLDAVRKSDVPTVKSLLAKGVNINTKFRYDRMALSFACDRGSVEMVKVLLDAGAEVNARDSFYQADAMEWAVNKGHLEIARMLLEKGARNDESILMMGVERNNPTLVKASLDRGGLPAESLTVALARANREDRTEIIGLLKNAGATPPFTTDAATLEKYAGTYRNETSQDLIIDHQDGVLRGQLFGQTSFPLVALAKDRFRPEALANVVATFVTEGDRTVSVTVRHGTNEISYKKVETEP